MSANNLLRHIGRRLLPALAFLGIFWLIAFLVDEPLLLPTPPAIASALISLVATGDFWLSLLFSLLRVFIGLLIGVVAGVLFGILTYLSPTLALFTRPLLTVVRSTPVATFVVLVWSITGSQILPIVIAALMVLPLVADGLTSGLGTVPPALIEVAALYRLSPWRRFLVLRLPAAIPQFLSAVTSAVGFAWKAGIAAEILAATSHSIGKEVYFANLYLPKSALWAYTLSIVVLSLLLELIVKKTLLFIKKEGEKRLEN